MEDEAWMEQGEGAGAEAPAALPGRLSLCGYAIPFTINPRGKLE
jgi:hypothetical protein